MKLSLGSRRADPAVDDAVGSRAVQARRPAWAAFAGALALGALASASGCAGHRNERFYVDDAYIVDAEFYVKALGNRCLDFGGEAWWRIGHPVYIYPCNGTAAQKVRVKEIADGSHDVELRVRNRYCLGVSGPYRQSSPGRPLELQACDDSPRQRFALDGDAILMGSQSSGPVTREFVVEPERGFTALRTPLVVGTREVSDSEYLLFRAVDGSEARPHSGFVVASSEADLDRELGSGGWGKVIELDDRQPILLSGGATKTIPAGVTLRGYRKHTYQGPELFRCSNSAEPLFTLNAEDVRLTGFRLRGPVNDSVRCPRYAPPRDEQGRVIEAGAIVVAAAEGARAEPRVLIDHLDLGYWRGTGIDIFGPGPDRNAFPPDRNNLLAECADPPVTYPRETRLRAVGNFLHNLNPYGVVAGWGAFPLIDGNVAYQVRNHVIASDGARTSGYLAYHNLMLSDSGSHEIDVHGSLDPGHWNGGIAGSFFDVGWNTILGLEKSYDGKSRVNVNLRGTPCFRFDLHDNVFRRSPAKSLASEAVGPEKFRQWNNIFGASAPLNDLAVGDFDGDGIDDVFTGTGAAWYFSSGGSAEWRFLNRMPEKASALRFGDFDGDGRTDVVGLHDGEIDVSWAGGSPWQTVNVTAWDLSDLAVGNFEGDGRDDLFLATGSAWFVAPAARNWAPYSFQAGRTTNLRFGDLTGDGRTDVVAGGGRWRMLTKHSGPEQWLDLHSSLSGSLSGVVAADFTGDGRADLARLASGSWRVSDAGATSWTKLRQSKVALDRLPIGRFFDGNATADVAVWSSHTELHFNYFPGGRDPIVRLSRQPMR